MSGGGLGRGLKEAVRRKRRQGERGIEGLVEWRADHGSNNTKGGGEECGGRRMQTKMRRRAMAREGGRRVGAFRHLFESLEIDLEIEKGADADAVGLELSYGRALRHEVLDRAAAAHKLLRTERHLAQLRE